MLFARDEAIPSSMLRIPMKMRSTRIIFYPLFDVVSSFHNQRKIRKWTQIHEWGKRWKVRHWRAPYSSHYSTLHYHDLSQSEYQAIEGLKRFAINWSRMDVDGTKLSISNFCNFDDFVATTFFKEYFWYFSNLTVMMRCDNKFEYVDLYTFLSPTYIHMNLLVIIHTWWEERVYDDELNLIDWERERQPVRSPYAVTVTSLQNMTSCLSVTIFAVLWEIYECEILYDMNFLRR